MSLYVLADPILAVRSYLLTVPEVTDITPRIVTRLPAAPAWPIVRIALISTTAVHERRYDRALVQLDCFAKDDTDAHRLARVVRAALVDSGSHVVGDAVLGGAVNTAVLPLPDETFTPAMPRYAVTAHVFIHPTP